MSHERRGARARSEVTEILCVVIALALLAAPAAGEGVEGWQVVPFSSPFGLIVVDTTVNGKGGLHFLFDTGSSITQIDDDLVDDLELSLLDEFLHLNNRAGANIAQYVQVDSVAIGRGGGHSGLRGAMYDLEYLSNLMGMEIHGILGYDFIHRHSLVVDYPSRRLLLRKPRLEGADGLEVEQRTLALKIVDRLPVVRLCLENRVEADFVLDTASMSSLVINESVWSQLGHAADDVYTLTSRNQDGSEFSSQLARLNTLSIDGLVLEDLLVEIQPATMTGFFGEAQAGLLGSKILNQFIIEIDYDRELVTLWPRGADIGAAAEDD